MVAAWSPPRSRARCVIYHNKKKVITHSPNQAAGPDEMWDNVRCPVNVQLICKTSSLPTTPRHNL